MGNSVSGLMVDLITPYTDPEQPDWMRAMALESLGLICQTWPQHFVKAQINDAFKKVFEEGNAEFQNVVLLSFRDFSPAKNDARNGKLIHQIPIGQIPSQED
jgi:cohesin loading factor subunit SCC2